MNIIEAKQKLLILSEHNTREEYEKISKEEYRAIFFAINKSLPFKDKSQNIAAKKFLYYGTLLFNKFNIPGPWIVENEDFATFKLFLAKLWFIEGSESGNAPHLELDKIKWDIYNAYNYSNLQNIVPTSFDPLIEKIEKLNIIDWYGEEKKKELNEKKEKLFQIIYGIKNNTIVTTINTRLPYGFTENDSNLTIITNGIKATVKTKIIYLGSLDTFMNVDCNSIIDIQGATRWQNKFTEIEIKINTLIDRSAYVTPIVFDNQLEVSKSWNSLFNITYAIIESLWWQLKQNGINTSYWCPTPKDFSVINYALCNNDFQIDFAILQNKAMVIKPKVQIIEELGDFNCDSDVQWYIKCYQHSKLYADVGQLKESLFWLNVSVEALISKFVESVLDDTEYNELTKGVNPYEASEEIVSEQFHDMKGKVSWPETIKHPSVYNILSKVIKGKNLPLDKKEVLKKYSNICSGRNDLFHGIEESVSADKLKKAIDSYDWLKDKLTQFF